MYIMHVSYSYSSVRIGCHAGADSDHLTLSTRENKPLFYTLLCGLVLTAQASCRTSLGLSHGDCRSTDTVLEKNIRIYVPTITVPRREITAWASYVTHITPRHTKRERVESPHISPHSPPKWTQLTRVKLYIKFKKWVIGEASQLPDRKKKRESLWTTKTKRTSINVDHQVHHVDCHAGTPLQSILVNTVRPKERNKSSWRNAIFFCR